MNVKSMLFHPVISISGSNTTTRSIANRDSRHMMALPFPIIPSSVPHLVAESLVNETLRILDYALELDAILEQTQALRATWHDPQVRVAKEALTEGIQAFLSNGEMPSRGDFPDGSTANELYEVFEDALSDTSTESFCSSGSKPADEEYFDALAGEEGIVVGRLHRVFAAFERIAHNGDENPYMRRLSNCANVALHSLISSGIPTFVRQAVAYAIERSLNGGNASMAARTTLGAVASALPLLLGMIGLVRDNQLGVATLTSNLSRGTGLVIGGGVLIAAGMSGSLAALAPTLAAYNLVHSVLSESLQSWLRLQDNSNPTNTRAAALTTASAVVTFMCINLAASHGASSSGQGRAAQSQDWQPMTDLTRGIINAAGVASIGLLSHIWRYCSSSPEAREDLRISLETALPSRPDLIQQLLSSYPLWSTLGTNIFLVDDMLAHFVETTGVNDLQLVMIRDALAAVVGGLQFPLVEGAMFRRPLPSPPLDLETGESRTYETLNQEAKVDEIGSMSEGRS